MENCLGFESGKMEVMVMWETDEEIRDFLGMPWTNGEVKVVQRESGVRYGYSNEFNEELLSSLDTGGFKFYFSEGAFKAKNGIFVSWVAERDDLDESKHCVDNSPGTSICEAYQIKEKMGHFRNNF